MNASVGLKRRHGVGILLAPNLLLTTTMSSTLANIGTTASTDATATTMTTMLMMAPIDLTPTMGSNSPTPGNMPRKAKFSEGLEGSNGEPWTTEGPSADMTEWVSGEGEVPSTSPRFFLSACTDFLLFLCGFLIVGASVDTLVPEGSTRLEEAMGPLTELVHVSDGVDLAGAALPAHPWILTQKYHLLVRSMTPLSRFLY